MQKDNEVLKKLDIIESLLKKKDDKPLNFNQAAEYLGFSHSYLYKLTSRKIVPCYRPTGKVLFFSKAELDEWVFGREHSAKDKAKDDDEDEGDEPP